ncbi:MAG: hypothetical protein MJ215_03390 [Spirochaetia bacterium]|nr:hypothetical protein [Spirochaetia bacterium]
MSVIGKERLISLLPHKGKMFLLDRVMDFDPEDYILHSQVDVTENSMFFDMPLHGIPSYVCFEYMAQSISALSGLVAETMRQAPKIGVILSVSDLRTEKPILDDGSTVDIHIKKTDIVDSVFSFTCSAFCDGKRIAEGKLTVMEVDNLNVLGI